MGKEKCIERSGFETAWEKTTWMGEAQTGE
jgi:hypothetical protein